MERYLLYPFPSNDEHGREPIEQIHAVQLGEKQIGRIWPSHHDTRTGELKTV